MIKVEKSNRTDIPIRVELNPDFEFYITKKGSIELEKKLHEINKEIK